jgi:hypothetical protein
VTACSTSSGHLATSYDDFRCYLISLTAERLLLDGLVGMFPAQLFIYLNNPSMTAAHQRYTVAFFVHICSYIIASTTCFIVLACNTQTCLHFSYMVPRSIDDVSARKGLKRKLKET